MATGALAETKDVDYISCNLVHNIHSEKMKRFTHKGCERITATTTTLNPTFHFRLGGELFSRRNAA